MALTLPGRYPIFLPMNTPPPSPEPTQGEPHPAVRLAEIVGLIVTAICGGRWSLWRLLPGGRAFRAQMQALSRDFTALMHRLAAGLPAPTHKPTPEPPRQSAPRSPASQRPKSVRAPTARPRRPSAVGATVPKAQPVRQALPAPPRDQPFRAFPPPQPEPPWPRAIRSLRKRHPKCVYFVTIP